MGLEVSGEVKQAGDPATSPLDGLRRRADAGKGAEFERLAERFLVVRFGASGIRRQIPDLGVDRLFTDRDGRSVAVQMKAYAPTRTVTYADLTKFIAAADTEDVDYLVLLTTSDRISRHAMKVINARGIVVFGFENLIEVDCWAPLAPATPPPPLEPFDFQREAIAAALTDVERGQIIMPTGSGKSLVEAEVARAHDSVLLMVPSIELVRQMAGDLRRQDPTRSILGVVSRSDLDTYGLPVENTTSPDYIRDYLGAVGRPLVLATYASGDAIVEGAHEFTFDLALYDEAHRTAGATPTRRSAKPALYKRTLTDVSAGRRRFFTATPRVHADAVKDWAEGSDAIVFSMDDPSVYGTVLYATTVKAMIDLGRLSPFEMAIGLVNDQAVYGLLRSGGYTDLLSEDSPDDLEDVAAVLHVLKAAEQFGLRRILTFHSRIASARRGARLFERLASDRGIRVRAIAIDSSSPSSTVHDAKSMLIDASPDVVNIVCNVKLFSEGVNTPALDAVAYFDPKSSVVDITQTIGRALRTHPGKERSYLLLPVMVGDAADAPSAIAKSDFRTIANVGTALRDMGVVVTEVDAPADGRPARVVTSQDGHGFLLSVTGIDLAWEALLASETLTSLVVEGFVQHPTDRLIRALTPEQFLAWASTTLLEIPRRAEELTTDDVLDLIDATVPHDGSRGQALRQGPAGSQRRAIAVMLRAGLVPLEPYSGSKSRWRCIHVRCGRVVSPRYNSVHQGQGGCGHCAGNLVEESEARLVMQSAGLEPLEPYPGAFRKWLCVHVPCGRRVTPVFNSVRQGQGGCAYCARRLVDPDLALSVMRAAGLEPQEAFPGSAKPWKSIHKQCGRVVSPRYNTVQQRGRGCPYCAGRKLDIDDALTVMEAAGLQPQEDFPGSTKPWKCIHTACGKSVTPTYYEVKRTGRGCPYCSGRAVDPDDAVAVMRAAGLEPLDDFPGSKAPWRCLHLPCGNTVNPTYGAVKSGQGGCAYCAGKAIDPHEAAEVMRRAGLEPQTPFPGSKNPWKCIHVACGREVTPAYGSVKAGQGGCKYCAGNVVDPEDAIEVMRAAGLEPLTPYPGSSTPWPSVHVPCGRQVAPRYGEVKKRGSGCGYCSGRRVSAEDAVATMRAAGLEPQEDYPGAGKPWTCIHSRCGRTVTPAYREVRKGGSGCVYCSGKVVDPDEAAATMRSAGLEPQHEYRGAAKPWACIHIQCGRLVSPRYSDVKRGVGICAFCAGQRPDPNEVEAVMRASGFEPQEEYPGSGRPWTCIHLPCGNLVHPTYTRVRTTGRGCPHCDKGPLSGSRTTAVNDR